MKIKCPAFAEIFEIIFSSSARVGRNRGARWRSVRPQPVLFYLMAALRCSRGSQSFSDGRARPLKPPFHVDAGRCIRRRHSNQRFPRSGVAFWLPHSPSAQIFLLPPHPATFYRDESRKCQCRRKYPGRIPPYRRPSLCENTERNGVPRSSFNRICDRRNGHAALLPPRKPEARLFDSVEPRRRLEPDLIRFLEKCGCRSLAVAERRVEGLKRSERKKRGKVNDTRGGINQLRRFVSSASPLLASWSQSALESQIRRKSSSSVRPVRVFSPSSLVWHRRFPSSR